jgi:hypothetical protein
MFGPFAHSGPHIELHLMGSLRLSARVWSWVVTGRLSVLAASRGC